MIVTPFQRANVISAVRSALDSAGLQNVMIMADESNRYEEFMAEAPFCLGSAAGNIGVVAHHDYGFASDTLSAAMGAEARLISGNKHTWFTEICCYVPSDSSQANDPTTSLTYAQGYEYVSPFLSLSNDPDVSTQHKPYNNRSFAARASPIHQLHSGVRTTSPMPQI